MEIYDTFGSCPRCSTGIDFREQPSICTTCGWMPNQNQTELTKKTQKTFIIGVLSFSLFVIAGFIHLVNWDKYSIEVIPLKTKTFIGLADDVDLSRLAEICEDRFKYDCTEIALFEVAQIRNQPEDYVKLGLLQRKLKAWQKSAQSYETALSLLQKTGESTTSLLADIYYGLAKANEGLNQETVAIDYYDRAITAKPEVIQITVTEDYLKLLKGLGQDKKAKRVVEEARRRGGSKSLFSWVSS